MVNDKGETGPDGWDWELLAQFGDVAGHDLSPKLPEPAELNFIQRIVANRPQLEPATAVNEITSGIDLEERNLGLVLGHDPIGLVRRLPDGRLEKYLEKYLLEHKEGNPESWWGVGNIGNGRAAVFSMNWKFMGGSLGVVSGEKFQLAGDLAKTENIPFVGIFTSGGVRQQENLVGLVQMERLPNAIRNFRSGSDKPYISVLAGEVWGGISASAAMLGDLTVALGGTNFGFSGPRVIETFDGQPVPEGAQSVEKNLLDRNIDLVVQSPEELATFLDRFIQVIQKPAKGRQLTKETIPTLRQIGDRDQLRTIKLGKTGIAPALYHMQATEAQHELPLPEVIPKDLPRDEMLMRRYENSIRSPSLLDSEFVIQNVFSEVVPLYNHHVDDGKKYYPAIIAAVGKIGHQPFLVVGNQPSYQISGDRVRRIPATPKPEDFEYARRMLKLGERLGLPIVFLTDTLGAEPSVRAEARGQSRAIAEMIYAANDYRHPVMSIVLNALGSGGGLATTPRGDYRAMMSSAMGYVAEPRSATAILTRKANPDREDVMLTLSTMSATAEDQLRLKLIDEIIPEAEDVYSTVVNIHDALAHAFADIDSRHLLHRRRNSRVRSMGRTSLNNN